MSILYRSHKAIGMTSYYVNKKKTTHVTATNFLLSFSDADIVNSFVRVRKYVAVNDSKSVCDRSNAFWHTVYL